MPSGNAVRKGVGTAGVVATTVAAGAALKNANENSILGGGSSDSGTGGSGGAGSESISPTGTEGDLLRVLMQPAFGTGVPLGVVLVLGTLLIGGAVWLKYD